jgi:hypothetical protein
VKVEQFAWRERIEVADEDVRSVLMLLDRQQQRAKLVASPLLRPRRVHGAQMDPHDPPRAASRDDFDEGVARDARLPPFHMIERLPRQVAERLAAARAPVARPASCANCSITLGLAASCRTTTSGCAARMTPASAASRPLPPWRML